MGNLRMPSTNKVIIAGRVAFEPELRYLQSGIAVANIRIANTKHYRTKDGEKKEKTTWVDVTIWNKLAEAVGERMKKGDPILVEGRLESEEWEDKDSGAKRSRVKITAEYIEGLEWPDDGQGGSERAPASGGTAQTPPPARDEPPIPEEDIPF